MSFNISSMYPLRHDMWTACETPCTKESSIVPPLVTEASYSSKDAHNTKMYFNAKLGS